MQQPNCIPLALDILRIPSVSADKAASKQVLEHIASYVATNTSAEVRWYESGGFSSLVLSNNPLAPNTYTTILNGHVDVVDAQYNGAFEPRIDHDKLYARGAFDMKAAVAMLVESFCTIVQKNPTISIAVMLTTDEEFGGLHGVLPLLKEHNYTADIVIIPDGGGPTARIVTKQKGVLFPRIQTTGVSAHGSRPDEGDNAIEHFMRDYQVFTQQLQKDPNATVNLASLVGSGPAMNAVADTCTAGLDIRAYNVEEALGTLRTCFADHDIVLNLYDAPYILNEHHQAVQSFIQTWKQHHADECILAPETGASDARLFANHNLPVLVCSVTGGNHHQADEWVSIDSIERCMNVLIEFADNMKK